MNNELSIKDKIQSANDMLACIDRLNAILTKVRQQNEAKGNNNKGRSEDIRVPKRHTASEKHL
jgi:hypothetical protein